MKFLLSPDKFKGSLSAMEVCEAIGKGLSGSGRNVEFIMHPLADGGEGSLEILENYLTTERVSIEVSNSIGEKTKAWYLLYDKNAYVELASASGLELLDADERNPMHTSTYGTGLMILDAINKGVENIFLFIGGSSTNDAGTGILKALGYKFLNKSGQELMPIGENLIKIRTIQSDFLKYNPGKVHFHVLCDVDNVLAGKTGAAYVYAKQKGASDAEIDILDQGLFRFSEVIKSDTGVDISAIKGGGAAGGVAAGMFGVLNAGIKSGIDFIIDITGFKQHLAWADFVVTGEGKLDKQSMQGKVVGKVALLSRKYNKPLILFVGKNDLSGIELQKLSAYYMDSVSVYSKNNYDAINNAKEYLTKMANGFLLSIS